MIAESIVSYALRKQRNFKNVESQITTCLSCSEKSREDLMVGIHWIIEKRDDVVIYLSQKRLP